MLHLYYRFALCIFPFFSDAPVIAYGFPCVLVEGLQFVQEFDASAEDLAHRVIVAFSQFYDFPAKVYTLGSGLGFNGAQMIYYLILRNVQTTKNCLKLLLI